MPTPDKSGYAKALRQYLKDNKSGSFEALAFDAGITKKTLENWAKGSCPTEDNALRAIMALGKTRSEAIDIDDALRVEFNMPVNEPSAPPRAMDQPQVQDPPKVAMRAHYAARSIPFLGREAELDRLQAFVRASDPFLWLQVSGEGGQGKSRLALELMHILRPAWSTGDMAGDDWTAGFLVDEAIERYEDRWDSWQPAGPTVLIADYVVGRGQTLGRVLRILSQRRAEFRHPVRLLFLERQPWNAVGALQLTRANRFSRRPGTADWFVALCDRHDGADPDVAEARFEDGLIHLSGLEGTHLTEIVRRSAALSGYDSSMLSDTELADRLGRIDASGRPLYAFLYGEVLAEAEGHAWTNLDVLDTVLDKDWKTRWAQADLNEPLPAFGDNHPSMVMAVLATMCERLEFAGAIDLPPELRTSQSHRYVAALMTDTFGQTPHETREVSGLEPDILGERFVLRSLGTGLMDIDRCLELAWSLDPAAMARFVLKISRDFLSDPITQRIIAYAP